MHFKHKLGHEMYLLHSASQVNMVLSLITKEEKADEERGRERPKSAKQS